jgi:hypothetical protein
MFFNTRKKNLNRTYILPKFVLFSNHFASDACLLDFTPSKLASPPNAEKKSWRHLIQSNASGSDVLPTRVSENEARVSEEDEIEDPDQIKRTRSGKVYLTQTTPIKSILKVSPSNHHDQETFKYQSPSDLEAYKIGLRQSIKPISEEQKRALKMNHGNLIYCSLKQWSQKSPRTGKIKYL